MLARAALVVVVGLGLVFRFANLDGTVYWHDEAITSLWLSGHSYDEMSDDVFTGREIGVEELRKYQQVNPDRGLRHTLQAAARGDPQVAPLHIVSLRVWVSVFGDSVTAIRSLSAVFSAFALLAVYWLSLELFRSQSTASIAVMLMSVSPYQVAYAQEARAYSLWMLLILLSTAALLRALRRETIESWGLYALLAAAAMYSHVLSAVVIFVHAAYVFGTEQDPRRGWVVARAVKQHAAATAVALALFVPWALAMIRQQPQADLMLRWVARDFAFASRAMSWGGGLIRNYFDFGWSELDIGASPRITVMTLLLGFFVLSLIGCGLYHCWRHRSRREWWLPLLLMVVPWLALSVPDVLFGGRRSAVPRYLSPVYLGALLSIAVALATQIASPHRWPRAIAQLSLAVVLCGGIASCILGWTAPSRWTKGDLGRSTLRAAGVVNEADHPLLITNTSIGGVLAVSRLLKPDVRLQPVYTPESVRVREGFSTIVLFRAPDATRTRLREQLNIEFELIDSRANLWRGVQRRE